MRYISYTPLFFLAVLVIVSWTLDFNGLYGQDAHEFLRQTRVLYGRLQGMPAPPPGIGEAEMGGGYPLAGALLQLLGLDAVPALQVASWLSATASLWLVVQILNVLSPGAQVGSRWVYVSVALALSPLFFRSGLTAMSDLTGLALALAALFFALRAIEWGRPGFAPGFAVFAVLAVTTRYALGVLLFVPGLALLMELWRQRSWYPALLALAAGLAAAVPYFWLRGWGPDVLFRHTMLQGWSLFHLFGRTFDQVSGTISYPLPNLLYLLYPLAHPAFCLVLPALFLLFKRTDVHLNSKRILAFSLLFYLLFLGGLPNQNLRFLLPAYVVLLLLCFPAWDRFFAYGLYFFRRLVYALLGFALVLQLGFCVYFFKPTLERNHLEQQVARVLDHTLEADAVVYGFDLDIALRSYLPDVEFRNLWVRQYDRFPEGSYFLFNAPKLREQWSGQPPMQNWEYATTNYILQEIRFLPEGWVLYKVIKQK